VYEKYFHDAKSWPLGRAQEGEAKRVLLLLVLPDIFSQKPTFWQRLECPISNPTLLGK